MLAESTNSDRKAKASHYGMKLNLAATPGLALRADPFSAPTTMSTSIRTVSPMSGLTIGSQAVPKMPDVTSISNVKLQPANPFFDNIRQNLELSHGGITERIPLGLAPDVLRRATELPSWLGNLVNLPDTECSEILANQFYRIERGEQKRLQAVMDFHSRGSGGSWPKSAKHDPDPRGEAWFEQRAQDAAEVKRLAAWTGGTQTLEDQYFPFSITAGVERGTKNRSVRRSLNEDCAHTLAATKISGHMTFLEYGFSAQQTMIPTT